MFHAADVKRHVSFGDIKNHIRGLGSNLHSMLDGESAGKIAEHAQNFLENLPDDARDEIGEHIGNLPLPNFMLDDHHGDNSEDPDEESGHDLKDKISGFLPGLPSDEDTDEGDSHDLRENILDLLQGLPPDENTDDLREKISGMLDEDDRHHLRENLLGLFNDDHHHNIRNKILDLLPNMPVDKNTHAGDGHDFREKILGMLEEGGHHDLREKILRMTEERDGHNIGGKIFRMLAEGGHHDIIEKMLDMVSRMPSHETMDEDDDHSPRDNLREILELFKTGLRGRFLIEKILRLLPEMPPDGNNEDGEIHPEVDDDSEAEEEKETPKRRIFRPRLRPGARRPGMTEEEVDDDDNEDQDGGNGETKPTGQRKQIRPTGGRNQRLKGNARPLGNRQEAGLESATGVGDGDSEEEITDEANVDQAGDRTKTGGLRKRIRQRVSGRRTRPALNRQNEAKDDDEDKAEESNDVGAGEARRKVFRGRQPVRKGNLRRKPNRRD